MAIFLARERNRPSVHRPSQGGKIGRDVQFVCTDGRAQLIFDLRGAFFAILKPGSPDSSMKTNFRIVQCYRILSDYW
jgi:hypothetical protein